MAAFILVHTFRKSLRHHLAWRADLITMVFPTADIQWVQEQQWGIGEDYDIRRAAIFREHPERDGSEISEQASSGVASTVLTTIILKERLINFPVIHKIEEVQNAMNSARGRPF